LLGPANRRLDLSLRKQTAIKENLRFTIVAEFFNFTNTPQFGPPDVNLRSPTYGRTLGPGGGLGANTLGPFGALIPFLTHYTAHDINEAGQWIYQST